MVYFDPVLVLNYLFSVFQRKALITSSVPVAGGPVQNVRHSIGQVSRLMMKPTKNKLYLHGN